MKRFVALILTIVLVFSLTACGSNSTSSVEPVKTNKSKTTKYKTFEDIENDILKDEEQTIADITEKIEKINSDIDDDYDNYIAAVPYIDEWYDYTLEETNAFYERLNNYIIEYYKLIASKVGLSDYNEWTDKIEDAYYLWVDALEDYYDAWCDLYEDNYDYYSDIINDAYDLYNYDTVSDTWGDMYDMYNDSWKDMYRSYDDAWKVLYRNYNDIFDGFYDGEDNVVKILKLNEK